MSFELQELLLQASMTIREAKNSSDSEVYVVNTSDLGGRLQRGDVQLKFNLNGKIQVFPIRDTWVPKDLSVLVPKDVLFADTTFVQAVERRVLTLIKPDIAKEILETDQAQDELARLRDIDNRLENSRQSIEDQIESEKNRSQVREAIKQTTNANKPLVESRSSEGQNNIKVVSILTNSNLDERSKIAALSNIVAQLKSADFDYIMSQSGKDHTKLKNWVIEARKRIAA